MAQKIITFANHKGGVSKTTSTASIGACMAMKGKKVLLIDLDGQANLTLYISYLMRMKLRRAFLIHW